MKIRTLAVAVSAVLLLAACSSAHHAATVPSVSGAGQSVSGGGSGAGRAAALHAAAQCIRQHGVPNYQDPALDAEGHVYTDSRSIQDAENAAGSSRTAIEDGLRQACGTLITAAGFQPADQAPAPPQLVQAGVKSSECLRANGLPNITDPTSATDYTPGHGFSLNGSELPQTGAGKGDPTVQRAFAACRSVLDDEIRQSSLTALAHD